MNPVWQPQAPAAESQPTPQATLPQDLQQQYQQQYHQPAESAGWAADVPQQSGKRPQLTADPGELSAAQTAPAFAVSPAVVMPPQPEIEQQHSTAAQSRFEQLYQLAEASLDGSFYAGLAANPPPPAATSAPPPPPGQNPVQQNSIAAASVAGADWQPEAPANAPLPTGGVALPLPRRSRLTDEVQQAVAASVDRAAEASRCAPSTC